MSTTTNTSIYAGWWQEMLAFPDPGHHSADKPINIACHIDLRANDILVTVHTVCRDAQFNNGHRQGWTNGIQLAWNAEFIVEAEAAPGAQHDVPVSVPGTETPAVLQSQTWQGPINFAPNFYSQNDPNAPDDSHCSPPINSIVDPAHHRGDTNNWWGRDKSPEDTMAHMAAHEFGHYIGCGDEYGLHEANFKRVVGRAPRPDERMWSGGKPNGLYSTRDSIMGWHTDQFPKRRHGQRIVDWLNENYIPRQGHFARFTLRMISDVPQDTPVDGQDWSWYSVQENEWLSHIAERYGMTWDQLYNYDPTGSEPNRTLLSSGDPNLIYPNEQIRVPNGA